MRERVFEKDGDRRTTAVPSAAVDLLARGYDEILDEPPARFTQTVQRHTPQRPPNDERNNAPD